MFYPVILAGGTGTRLWPLSTKANPKQINYLLGEQSLLQATYQRLITGWDKADIFLVTNQQLAPAIQQQLNLADTNLFIEPISRNTAAAIGFAAINLLVKDPEAVMVTINSDAYIKEVDKYITTIKQAGKLAQEQPDKFVLLGIKPQYPETGYGYIHWGEKLTDNVYQVQSFKEKPSLEIAKEYYQSQDHLWNPAIFVFTAKSLLEWYKIYLPEVYDCLDKIHQLLLSKEGDYQELINELYLKMPSISIDYGLLEKLNNMLVIPVDITWADIGHWRSLRDVQLAGGDKTNIVKGKHIAIDSHNNLLYAENKLIATVGVEDMILVETAKVIFLCPASRAHEVKDLLAKLSEQGLEDYL